ncbi:MAG: 3D domain-containing protein, partial [Clostridium sporogenes]|nr:3D domain-containing protein [Clostridium sporogenes]
IAEDTGGAIKGNVIDLYFDSNVEVSNWGSRWVNVYILD